MPGGECSGEGETVTRFTSAVNNIRLVNSASRAVPELRPRKRKLNHATDAAGNPVLHPDVGLKGATFFAEEAAKEEKASIFCLQWRPF